MFSSPSDIERATAIAPDADSWVAEFLAWWIDQEPGFRSRAGRCSALLHPRLGQDRLGRSAEDLMQYMPRPEELPPGVDPPRPISVTFIRQGV